MCARASTPGSAQEPSCDRPCPAEIDDADMALAKHRHDLADVSHARCSGLGDGRPCRCLGLAFIQLPGQKAFNDRDLLTLLLSEIGAVALLVLRNSSRKRQPSRTGKSMSSRIKSGDGLLSR